MVENIKDPGTVAAEVKMSRMVHKGAFLVVEGKDDLRFWKRHRHQSCELVWAGGKHNVVGCIQRLDASGELGVIGVIDDDYDQLMNRGRSSENLVATDAHDLESLLCRSEALDAVLAEFGESSKIDAFRAKEGTGVRQGLLDRALVFGRLRWASERFGLAFDQDAVRVPRFVVADTWEVDETGLIEAVVAKDVKRDEEELRGLIDRLPVADGWRVVRGHDLVAVLRIGLMKVLGNVPASVGNEDIARVLRAGISLGELDRTGLGLEIRAWEAESEPYRVLSEGFV